MKSYYISTPTEKIPALLNGNDKTSNCYLVLSNEPNKKYRTCYIASQMELITLLHECLYNL